MSKLSDRVPQNNICPVDRTLFEENASGSKIYCSPKCKKIADAEKRRQKKFHVRLAEYRRLGGILGLEDGQEATMLRKQLQNADNQLSTNGRVILFSWLVIAALVVALIVVAQ